MKFPSVSTWLLCLFLAMNSLGLMVLANLSHKPAQAAPWLQVTTACEPQATPTPVSSCPSGNPVPVLGRQPRPTEMVSTFINAGLNRLGNIDPPLPQIWQGKGSQARKVSPYVPCILLEAIAYNESVGWKQFDAPYNACGFTKVGVDSGGSCGYGVAQITSGMNGGGGFDQNRVVAEYAYNIGAAAKILIDKWNGLSYWVGANTPQVVEDWYYAVWAYNGFSWINNPNNSRFAGHRGEVWLCGADPGQRRSDFPYQELIWGCAVHPPGDDYWQAVQLSLPSDNELKPAVNEGPPPTHLARSEPSHGSCSAVYLPLIERQPTPTPTPPPSCVDVPLVNSNFGGGLIGWTVWISKPDFINEDLFSYAYKDPYDSFPAAYLGGEIDRHQASTDVIDQYISQKFTVPNLPGSVDLHLAYSYCLTTDEENIHEWDKFWVDLRTADLVKSVLSTEIKYTNLTATDTVNNDCAPTDDPSGWHRRGLPPQDGNTALVGDGLLRIDVTAYKGDPLAITFRSEVDGGQISTFYFDRVVLKACSRN